MTLEYNPNNEILDYTAQIVASYVSSHTIPREQIPDLIQEIYQTMSSLSNAPAADGTGFPVTRTALAERRKPAVAIENSVTDDYIVCLEDGRQLKMLKRYLKSQYNMTPEQYRERWNLPADYPMVAPSYARKRSSLARSIGLGTRGQRKQAKVEEMA